MIRYIFGLRSMGKSRAVSSGLVRHIVGPHRPTPRELVRARNPELAAMLDDRLNGKYVDLRKHLTAI